MVDRPIEFTGPMVLALLREAKGECGGKTQTRRKAWWKPAGVLAADVDLWRSRGYLVEPDPHGSGWLASQPATWQRAVPGDRLWVREICCGVDDSQFGGSEWIDYKATPRYSAARPAGWENAPTDPASLRWRSARYMSRKQSRLTLTVTAVRRQKLQELTDADAMAEGATMWPACLGFRRSPSYPFHDNGWSMDWSRIGKPSPFGGKNGVLSARDVALGSPIVAFAAYFNDLHGPGTWERNPEVVSLTFSVQLANIDAPAEALSCAA